jgi:hypothetical protein
VKAKTPAARQHIIDNYSLEQGLSQLEALFIALLERRA